MSVSIVRKLSETPNISIPDDCRMFHYAVGGYDGYVPEYLEECAYAISGRDFTVKSGELLVGGYQVDIDIAGATITAISSASTYYYTVYLELDLQIADSPIATMKASYSLDSYPEISVGENLTANPNGVRRVVLYRFIASNNEISSVEKLVSACEYDKSKFETINSHLSSLDGSITSLNNRLNLLGFSSATASIYTTEYSDGSGYSNFVGTAYFYRLGRFVICRLYSTIGSSYLPYVRMPYLIVHMTNQLKSFVRASSGTIGTHYVYQNSTHTIGGKGTIARNNGNTNGSILIDCYDKVTITSDPSATNFLTSDGALYALDSSGNDTYITMKNFDVALGWLCISPES